MKKTGKERAQRGPSGNKSSPLRQGGRSQTTMKGLQVLGPKEIHILSLKTFRAWMSVTFSYIKIKMSLQNEQRDVKVGRYLTKKYGKMLYNDRARAMGICVFILKSFLLFCWKMFIMKCWGGTLDQGSMILTKPGNQSITPCGAVFQLCFNASIPHLLISLGQILKVPLNILNLPLRRQKWYN